MCKIACILPSRGLIYARTVKGLFENARDYHFDLYVSDNLPIPDCFNFNLKTAFANGSEYVWMVEEDNELPDNILYKLLKEDKDIVTLDYNVGKGVSHIQQGEGKENLWCGIGCTLIKKKVFDKLEYPWFRVDKQLMLNTGEWVDKESKFGGHDVWFFTQARKAGFEINVLKDIKGQHYRAKELPKRENNNGLYTIYSL